MLPNISPVKYDYPLFAPSIEMMKPALEFADDANFEELRRESKNLSSFQDRLFLSLIRPLNRSMYEVRASILLLTPEEAQLGLVELSRYETIISEIRVIGSNSSRLDQQNMSEIEREMFSLIKNLVSIFDELNVIASSEPVDEESNDYQNFISNLVSEFESTSAKHGKKALFALFED